MATAPNKTLLREIKELAVGRAVQQETDRQLLDCFTAQRDENAFAQLVQRHGPLVLRVCRRVLHQEQDAEDAFQATFLVLARQAGSIRKRESLASWLHGVAYRTALKAKRSAARRRHHEAKLHQRTPPVSACPAWDDLQAVLDAEIQRLPEAFREAFVLCVLEGKTVAAAAAELGVKEGTLSWRLTRARQRLQQQLARRSIQLAALLAVACIADSVRATVPAELARSAIRFGLLGAAGGPAVEPIPPVVAALAAGVSRAMFLTKAKIATIVLLATGLLVAAAGALLHQQVAARERPVANTQSQARSPIEKPTGAEDKDAIVYSGQVLGPDDRPVRGARLYLAEIGVRRQRPLGAELVSTGADGRFRFTVPQTQFGDRYTVVAATAANFGSGCLDVRPDDKKDDLTLRLVADDVPIIGQIIDLEGKPVPGATLTVREINPASGADLRSWLKAVKGKALYRRGFNFVLPPKVTTDAEGRFRLTGVGRNRLVRVQLDGPTIASQFLHVLTEPGETITVPDDSGPEPRSVTCYAPNFRHAAVPTRPILGIVRDKDTRKPLAGVKIKSFGGAFPQPEIETTTDAEGRYRLVGMPIGRNSRYIVALPGSDEPYVASWKELPDTPFLNPVTVDGELKRGIWIEGKITDKVTGKPLQWGAVDYDPMATNPHLRDYPGADVALSEQTRVVTKADGSYRVIGLPGPGVVGVLYYRETYYLKASDREDEFGTKERSLGTRSLRISPSRHNALTRIDPAKGAKSLKCDLTLDPGWSATVTVLGPDDKPLADVRRFGLVSGRWTSDPMKLAEFTMGFNPHQPQDVLLQHLEKGLVGVAHPPKVNGGSVTVRLEPGAVVTGRLMGADGRPLSCVELEVWFQPTKKSGQRYYFPRRIKSNSAGRFRITALLPGCEFRLSNGVSEYHLGPAPRSGETKDLGDVQLKRAEE